MSTISSCAGSLIRSAASLLPSEVHSRTTSATSKAWTSPPVPSSPMRTPLVKTIGLHTVIFPRLLCGQISLSPHPV